MEKVSPAQNESFNLWQVFTKKGEEDSNRQLQKDAQQEQKDVQVELEINKEIARKKQQIKIDA